MDLETESLEQEMHISSDEILIHIPAENQEMLSADMKEEHLDQMHLLVSMGDEHEDIEEQMHEELRITKLNNKVTKKRVSLTIEKVNKNHLKLR